MTPGSPDPRPSGFGLASWLWWPVVFFGWGLAGAVMLGESALGGRGAPSRPVSSPPPPPARPGRRRPFLSLLAALAGLSTLAACAGPDFRGSMGGPPKTAAASPFAWPDDYLDQARMYCLGDGAPPAPGASTGGGDLASCQALVAGRYGRGMPP